MITGQTQLAAVVGSPIRHSLSPVIFNAAFAAAGLDWALVALEVGDDDASAALAGARALGLRGMSVTMPLKSAFAGLVDEKSESATRLGAVNSVRISSSGLEGDNTDGAGFLDSLHAEVGWDANGSRCAVLGAGGAARAVVLALAGAGARDIVVINRSPQAASTAALLGGDAGRVGTADDIDDAEVLINATAVGMAGTPTEGLLPIDPAHLHQRQLVVDVVYHPLRTPLLESAAKIGAVTVGGVGMLVHQAARQFSWWTGISAPVAEMHRAADAALRA